MSWEITDQEIDTMLQAGWEYIQARQKTRSARSRVVDEVAAMQVAGAALAAHCRAILAALDAEAEVVAQETKP